MERSVAGCSPCRFRTFGECEEVIKEDQKLEEELAAKVRVRNLGQVSTRINKYSVEHFITSSSSKSGLVKNFAKKYSLPEVSSTAASGSRFRFSDAVLPVERLPIIARSLVVASLITGSTLLTASRNSVKVLGDANNGGLENGNWRDQNVL